MHSQNLRLFRDCSDRHPTGVFTSCWRLWALHGFLSAQPITHHKHLCTCAHTHTVALLLVDKTLNFILASSATISTARCCHVVHVSVCLRKQVESEIINKHPWTVMVVEQWELWYDGGYFLCWSVWGVGIMWTVCFYGFFFHRRMCSLMERTRSWGKGWVSTHTAVLLTSHSVRGRKAGTRLLTGQYYVSMNAGSHSRLINRPFLILLMELF